MLCRAVNNFALIIEIPLSAFRCIAFIIDVLRKLIVRIIISAGVCAFCFHTVHIHNPARDTFFRTIFKLLIIQLEIFIYNNCFNLLAIKEVIVCRYLFHSKHRNIFKVCGIHKGEPFEIGNACGKNDLRSVRIPRASVFYVCYWFSFIFRHRIYFRGMVAVISCNARDIPDHLISDSALRVRRTSERTYAVNKFMLRSERLHGRFRRIVIFRFQHHCFHIIGVVADPIIFDALPCNKLTVCGF